MYLQLTNRRGEGESCGSYCTAEFITAGHVRRPKGLLDDLPNIPVQVGYCEYGDRLTEERWEEMPQASVLLPKKKDRQSGYHEEREELFLEGRGARRVQGRIYTTLQNTNDRIYTLGGQANPNSAGGDRSDHGQGSRQAQGGHLRASPQDLIGALFLWSRRRTTITVSFITCGP